MLASIRRLLYHTSAEYMHLNIYMHTGLKARQTKREWREDSGSNLVKGT